MTYEIFDNGASIRFAAGTLEQLIVKKHIHRISVRRDDIIEIKLVHPWQSLFFRHRNVIYPVVDSAITLRNLLNTMTNT